MGRPGNQSVHRLKMYNVHVDVSAFKLATNGMEQANVDMFSVPEQQNVQHGHEWKVNKFMGSTLL